MVHGTKVSIYLDGEATMIVHALCEKENVKLSRLIQRIIKEWAKDRGIEVEVTVTLKGV